MAKHFRTAVDETIAHFAALEDPRSPITRQPLVSVVVIALMAVLAGAGGPTAIARWANTKKEFLLRVLPWLAGIPRKCLSPCADAAESGCVSCLLLQLAPGPCAKAAEASGVDQPVFAVDGKTARLSHDPGHGLGALHAVSVWASEYGLSLGLVAPIPTGSASAAWRAVSELPSNPLSRVQSAPPRPDDSRSGGPQTCQPAPAPEWPGRGAETPGHG